MSTAELKYFAPICLYPHTAYRSSEGLVALFEKYQLQDHEYLIVIADRLLALDNLVTGRYYSKKAVFSKARKEAEQIYNLVTRVSRKAKAHERGRIVYWDDVAETPHFEEFAQRLRAEFLQDELMASALEGFVNRRVERFGLGGSPREERNHEREYLLSEVCMSVFCTEVLGFWTEIWEKPPSRSLPDPLRLLYANRPNLLAKATGHAANRVVEFLFDGDR
jgi:tRNA-dependent cyclodipeptide synthase